MTDLMVAAGAARAHARPSEGVVQFRAAMRLSQLAGSAG